MPCELAVIGGDKDAAPCDDRTQSLSRHIPDSQPNGPCRALYEGEGNPNFVKDTKLKEANPANYVHYTSATTASSCPA